MAEKAPRPQPDEMTFLEHLDELRSRLIRSVVALIVSFALCGVFVRPIFTFVQAPIKQFLGGQNLVFTRLSEPFFIYMKVAFLASLFLAAPYVLSELWLFVAPGLYSHERRYALPFVMASSLLFLSGGAFGYYMVFPATCRFFLQVGEGFTPMIKADEYLSLFSMVIGGVGLVFEVPAVIFLLARAGLVTPRFLLRNTRYAILLSFVTAAIITPTPDPVTCSAVAIPMIVLYLIGIGVAALAGRSKEKEGDGEAPTA